VKRTDRLLQRWRVRRALEWIPDRASVLDVGCADGALFDLGRARIRSGVGIEPDPSIREWRGPDCTRRVPGRFPDAVPDGEHFDAITMLAVVEHVEDAEIREWAQACQRLLRPGGRVIATIPSPLVDRILHIGMALRLLDGMDAHQHHGLDPRGVPTFFTDAGFTVETHDRFQLGLNNLIVLRKGSATPQHYPTPAR
jgi:SAM-dependent methyltransferase